MATKQEVINYLNQNFEVETTDGGMFKFLFNLGEGRSQVVFSYVSDLAMLLYSPFAREDELTPALAFKLGEDAIFGTKRLASLYCLTHTVFLQDLDESEIVHGLQYLAVASDGLERSVGGDNF